MLEAIARWQRSARPPLPEGLTAAVGLELLAWLQSSSSHVHRDAFARLGCMSPEQARGRVLDAKSDLFSIALLLFELRSGHPAFASVADLAAGELQLGDDVSALMTAVRAVFARELTSVEGLRAALEACSPAGRAELDGWMPASPAEVVAPLVEVRPVVAPTPASQRWAPALMVLGFFVVATLGGLFAYEARTTAREAAQAALLRPCEIISEPVGATLLIDGVAQQNRAPTVVRFEPGREYQLELRTPTAVAKRRVRDQKRLSVRLADGAVLENDVYGGVKPAPVLHAQPRAPVAPTGPARAVDYDLEAAPAAFTLWPEHQLLVPDSHCATVKGDDAEITWPYAQARRRDGITLALVGGRATADDRLLHRDGEEACLMVLTDRSSTVVWGKATLSSGGVQTAEIEAPRLYVAGEDRMLVRSAPFGAYDVHVEGPLNGPRPVMVLGNHQLIVLNEPVTRVQHGATMWFTVPVRGVHPDLQFSVRIEKVR